MINKDRIVPIQVCDLLSMYALVFKCGFKPAGFTVIDSDVEGDFIVESDSAEGAYSMCSQPVKSLNFAEGVTTANILFVPAYDFEGFKINGVAVEPTGDEIAIDYALYGAVLSGGAVAVAKLGV